jgi:hypothetical protein
MKSGFCACRKPLKGIKHGLCEDCKELGRRLVKLHQDGCTATHPVIEQRIELYIQWVKNGGRLEELWVQC